MSENAPQIDASEIFKQLGERRKGSKGPKKLVQRFNADKAYSHVCQTDDPTLLGPGWDLIAIVHQETLCEKQISLPLNDGRGYPIERIFRLPSVMWTAKYVMGRTRDKALASLGDDLALARTERDDARQSIKDLGKEAVRLTEERDQARTEMRNRQDEHKAMRKENIAFQKRHIRCEGDLAKLRKAIGELEFKKIIGDNQRAEEKEGR